ncbi:MAG: protein-L-isoaspartate(D-aspartate) O-methyltransferase [Candidatus Aminicenantales bacterium]
MGKNFEKLRERMIAEQIEARGIKDRLVLKALRKVPRHLFVPPDLRVSAYYDEPLPIGEGQTVSQPYIVAYMTEVLELKGHEKVLEVGTGSGYQTAVLAEISRYVYTVEIIEILSVRARKILRELGYKNIHFKVGDGTFGWKEYSPFDRIIVTAAPSKVPRPLKEQLKVSGKMVIPVGSMFQELFLVTRDERKFRKKKLLPVRFVPLVATH